MMIIPGRSVRFRLFVAFGLLAIVLWAAIALALNAAHREIINRASAEGRNLAQSLAEHVRLSVSAIDRSLRVLRDEWEKGPGPFAVAVARYQQFLTEESVLQVAVIDADGWAAYSNLPNSQRVDLRDREHFKVQKERGTDELYISAPVLGRVSKQWTIQFTRPIYNRQKQFAGVLVFALPPPALERTYQDIELGEKGIIALVRSDGQVLARSRELTKAATVSLSDARGLDPHDAVSGEFRGKAKVDGVERFYSYYKVGPYPLTLRVGQAVDTVLAPYYTQRTAYLGSGVLATVLLLAVTLLLISRLERRDKESGERARNQIATIVENSNDAIVGRDLEGKIVIWNAAAERLLGWTAAEAIGQGLAEMFLPEEQARIAEHRKRVTQGGTMTHEAVRIAKDGRRIDILLALSPIKDDRGNIVGSAAVFRDFTEHKRAERRQALEHAVTPALAEAETLADGIPRIIQTICESLGWACGHYWRWDEEAELLRCVETWHIDAAEVAEFVVTTSGTVNEAPAWHGKAPGTKTGGLVRRVWMDGAPVWFPDVTQEPGFRRGLIAAKAGVHCGFGVPVMAGAQPLGVLEFYSRDIVKPDEALLQIVRSIGAQIGQFIARRHAEEALRLLNQELENKVAARTAELEQANRDIAESEARMRLVTDSMPLMLAYLDRDQVYRYVNIKFIEWLGLSREEIIGRRVPDVLGPAKYAMIRKQVESALSGKYETYERQYETPSGGIQHVLAHQAPHLAADGQVLGYYALLEDITERKQAENAVVREQALLRTIIDTVPDYVYFKDASGRFVLANQAWLNERAMGEGQIAGKTVFDIFPAGLAEKMASQDAKVIETGVPMLEVEQNVVIKGMGHTTQSRWASISKVPLRDASGKIVGTVGISRDITERKHAEDALKASEERYRDLFEMSPVSMWLLNAETRAFVAVNDATASLYGYSSEEFLRMTSNDLYAPEDLPAYLDFLDCADRNEVSRREWRHRKKDGTSVQVEVYSRPLLHQGRPARLALVTDISARKQAEAALRESEERLRGVNAQLQMLIQCAPLAVYTRDPNGLLTSWNAAAEKMFGWTAAEVLGKPLPSVPEEARAASNGSRKRLLAGDAFIQHEARRRRRDGTPIDIDAFLAPLRDTAGNINGIIAVVADITERKRAEEALQQAKTEAEAASRAKSQFLANMSHEIRTPMNGVLGMVELLLDTRLDETQHRFAETIRRSGETLLSVINQILDFSKIEAGKLQLETVPFDVDETVSEVVELLADHARRKGLKLAYHFADGVPAGVVGDPVRLRQIVTNLLSNAIKFTAAGEVVTRVDSVPQGCGTAERTRLRFSVTDNGVGISKEAQSNLFQPFAQADSSTTRRFGGTGLGLAICKQLVDMMGGEIGVNSAPGAGSEFWFTLDLPLGPARAEPRSEASLAGMRVLMVDDNPTNRRVLEHHVAAVNMAVSSAADGVEATNGGSRAARLPQFTAQVLLVEDNPVNQEVAVAMLQDLGCAARVAGNGRAAVSAFALERPDLVLMDCQMPEMDGFEATVRIREQEGEAGGTAGGSHPRSRTPIIALTANAMDGDCDRCLASGMDDYVSKPFTREQLANMLKRWLPAPPAAEPDAPRAGNASTARALAPTQAAAPPGANTVDLAALDKIRALQREGAPSLVHKIVTLYVSDSAKLVENMRQALSAADAPQLRRFAHTLKSSSAHLGAKRLAEHCERLEAAARNGALDGAGELLNLIDREHRAACSILNQQLA
jgi:PAS domain S-box-containing protein